MKQINTKVRGSFSNFEGNPKPG